LLPYFAPALLGLLQFRPDRGRVFLALAVALVAAGFFTVRPFNFYGGGGALANRYLLPVYPAFWFMAARPARLRGAFAAVLVAAPFLWPLWLQPRAFPWTPEGGYRYVSNTARRLLPYETTQSHLKPEAPRTSCITICGSSPGTETRAVAGGSTIGCFRARRRSAASCWWEARGRCGPCGFTNFRVRPCGRRHGRIERTRNDAAGIHLDLGKPYARHAMWWTPEDFYLYRLVLAPRTRPLSRSQPEDAS
jgi:hypothetical protein